MTSQGEVDIEREQLELLVKRDNPTAWIAKAILSSIEEPAAEATTTPISAD